MRSQREAAGDEAGRQAEQEAAQAAAVRQSGEWYVARMDEFDDMPASAVARRRSYELLDLPPGAAFVDVGCCSGRAVAELDATGARGIGIDLNPRAVQIAAERHPAGDFRTGSVFELPIADGGVLGYRADKLYHLIPDQPAALAEARRVLAPGGRIVLAGPEWDAATVDADDLALTRRIVHGRADQFPDLLFTRRARRHLIDAGFVDVRIDVVPGTVTGPSALPVLRTFASIAAHHGAVTEAEADGWYAEQERRAADDRLLFDLPVWLTSGRKPA